GAAGGSARASSDATAFARDQTRAGEPHCNLM
ncbi:MAG: hypothetical protein K0S29_1259, partial [Gammaproteobacteria bacterium]|nr:hypothetical protein [Gammaproteobacteria bacterium]